MLLLKPGHVTLMTRVEGIFTFQYASIKTYFLRSGVPCVCKFTFQYASIKTAEAERLIKLSNHLHFNMLLLKPNKERTKRNR